MIEKIKQHRILFITATIFIALGIILFFVDSQALMSYVYVGLGLLMVLIGLVTLGTPGPDKDFNLIFGLLYLLGGMGLLFLQNYIVSIVLAVLLVILPIIRIIRAQDKKLQLKKELPMLIIGLIIGFVGFEKIFVYLIASGLILFAIYLYYLVFSYKVVKPIKANRNSAIDANFTERDHK